MNKAKNKAQGSLIVVSAPSGCGKTTIVDRLIKRHPDWVRSVSVTTRTPRVGEKKNNDYYFVVPATFKEMEEKGELLESAVVFDHMYGTPKAFVTERLSAGENVILAIDVQGMKKIKKAADPAWGVASIFVLPPSIKILRERLEGRKTDSPDEIEQRIAMAQEEIKSASLYDFSVMNQNLEQTVLEIEKFIDGFQKERRKKSNAIHSS